MTIKHGLLSLGLMHAGRLVFQHLQPTGLDRWRVGELDDYIYTEHELAFYCVIQT